MSRARFLTIDTSSSIPVYRQIVDALRQRLVEGCLAPGSLLPPVRQLAVDLGIHFNTVAQAYRVLAEEGWLDLKRRRGALVLNRKPPAALSRDRRKRSVERLRALTAQLRAEGMPARQLAAELRRLADFIEREET